MALFLRTLELCERPLYLNRLAAGFEPAFQPATDHAQLFLAELVRLIPRSIEQYAQDPQSLQVQESNDLVGVGMIEMVFGNSGHTAGNFGSTLGLDGP